MDFIGMGREIRRHRKERQWTQAQLAEQAGISLSFLGHVERGSRKASIETIVRIAEVLHVTPDVLMVDSIGFDVSRPAPGAERYIGIIRDALDRLENEFQDRPPRRSRGTLPET